MLFFRPASRTPNPVWNSGALPGAMRSHSGQSRPSSVSLASPQLHACRLCQPHREGSSRPLLLSLCLSLVCLHQALSISAVGCPHRVTREAGARNDVSEALGGAASGLEASVRVGTEVVCTCRLS